MARMTMTKAMKHYAPSFEETFERFLSNRKAKGVSDKTLETYHYHFRAIGKYIDTDKEIDLLSKTDLEQMLANMRDAGLSSNSINSYTRTLKSFFSWCNEEDSATLKVSPYKLLKQESVKEYIKEIQKDRFEALNISADRIAEKLSDIAFAEKGDETYNTQAQLKALDLLQKQLGLQTQKVDANVSTDIVINIVGDN